MPSLHTAGHCRDPDATAFLSSLCFAGSPPCSALSSPKSMHPPLLFSSVRFYLSSARRHSCDTPPSPRSSFSVVPYFFQFHRSRLSPSPTLARCHRRSHPSPSLFSSLPAEAILHRPSSLLFPFLPSAHLRCCRGRSPSPSPPSARGRPRLLPQLTSSLATGSSLHRDGTVTSTTAASLLFLFAATTSFAAVVLRSLSPTTHSISFAVTPVPSSFSSLLYPYFLLLAAPPATYPISSSALIPRPCTCLYCQAPPPPSPSSKPHGNPSHVSWKARLVRKKTIGPSMG